MRKLAFGGLSGQCRYFLNVEFQVNQMFLSPHGFVCFVFDFGVMLLRKVCSWQSQLFNLRLLSVCFLLISHCGDYVCTVAL